MSELDLYIGLSSVWFVCWLVGGWLGDLLFCRLIGWLTG